MPRYTGGAARPRRATSHRRERHVKQRMSVRAESANAGPASDVAGIIVSLETELESVPRIAAYVWGPVPAGDEGAASIAA